MRVPRFDVRVCGVTFSNSHGVMRSNDMIEEQEGHVPERFRIDWGYSKDLYPQPEWEVGEENAPVSYSRNEEMRLLLDLAVEKRGAVPSAVEGRIVGHPVGSSDPGFDFASEPFTLTDGSDPVPVFGTSSLPDWPAHLENEIQWTFHGTRGHLDLGISGPHTVFVTFDHPIKGDEYESYTTHLSNSTHEDGATCARMREATRRVHRAGPCTSVELIKRLFAAFPRYVLGPENLSDEQWREVLGDEDLGIYMEQVDWPQFHHADRDDWEREQLLREQGGAWPLAVLERYGGECQAIVRFIRGVLMQVGHNEGELHTMYVSAKAPKVPVIQLDRGRGCSGPKSRDPNYDYALVDQPLEVGGRYAQSEVMRSNYEAFLMYRYREHGQWYRAWYGGGEGLIDGPQAEPLSEEFKTRLLDVFAGLAECRWIGNGAFEVTNYWSYR